jgi:hypothetical protein
MNDHSDGMQETNMTMGMCAGRAGIIATLLGASAMTSGIGFTGQAFGQTLPETAAAARLQEFRIPAQPLEQSLKAFIRLTGWQIGYPAGLTGGKQSSAVAGRLLPQQALQNLLEGTGIGMRLTGADSVILFDPGSQVNAPAGEEGTTLLDPVLVHADARGVKLGTDSLADTGTSTLSGGQIALRSQGGDANGILRNLPNAQYQNDISTTAGATDQIVIDLRPREVSISGARVYENNFILNGMDINTVTGSQDRYGTTADLEDGKSPPNADRMFDLHSQTIYVPSDFVEKVTVIDSNASAKYGNFQGGVVSYDLQNASKDRLRGGISTDFTTSDWSGFILGTDDGLNPANVARNEYLQRRTAITLTGPLTDNIAVLGEYSRSSGVTNKERNYIYTQDRDIEENSKNEFYRGQVLAETDFGDFTLEGVYTRYSRSWENTDWRDMAIDLSKRSFASKLQHDYELEDLELGGLALSNVKLQSKLGFSTSNSLNDKSSNTGYVYDQAHWRAGQLLWQATEQSSWCQTGLPMTSGTQVCYEGATGGDLEQAQERWDWSQELTGDVGNGTFLLGADYSHVTAHRRRPEEAVYFSNYTTLGEVTGVSAFNCGNAEACSPEQFAVSKTIYKAFNTNASLNSINTYGEVEQTWDWFTLRAGGRLSYDDYMKNLDVAPRVVATVTPWQDFAVSAGYNRYYDAKSLAFAIRDGQPRPQTFTRSRSGATVPDTWRPTTATYYVNSASDLDTPYTDEFTLSLSGTEPLMDGDWRIRYLDRRAKDQYATQNPTSSGPAILTNDGTGAYQSVSAEYTRELATPGIPGLDELAFNAAVTWSQREVSNNSYFESDLDDEYVWYKNQSYTKEGFSVVTGNMDIPVRLQAGLASTWFEERLNVNLSANYNFAYTGVKSTETNITVNGITHEIYEDFDFDGLLTFDLAASYTAYKKDDRSFSVNIKVENLFNEIGNATANDDHPWIIGRTVWVGAKATF